MIATLSYASTNVTSSAYTTLIASLSTSCGSLIIVDTSTQLMKLAVGPAGSEVDLCVFQGNGYPVSIPNTYLIPGTRLSLKAMSTSATTGFNAVSYIG